MVGIGRGRGPFLTLQVGSSRPLAHAARTGPRPLSTTPAAPRPRRLCPRETELGRSMRVDRAREGRLAWLLLRVAGFREWAHSLLFCLCFCHVLIPKKACTGEPQHLPAGFSGPRPLTNFWTTPASPCGI